MKKSFLIFAFLFCVSFIFANNTNPVTISTNPPAVTNSDSTQNNTPQVHYVVSNLPKAEPTGTCRHCSACEGRPVCIWCDCSNCDFTLLWAAMCNASPNCCYTAE